ncbi:MAG TPA: PhoH family protein [Sandaracinaceae bacterium LLY-WYZ-13_1]|nr:PhoH family protein [Sandaracinaceae bacterium LLY-WYZ-13_1]
MIKNFVLDTNVLLHDPGALYAFEENAVILPIYVIEEIDKFKREMSELGRSARGVSRSLDELRAQGNLAEGVDLPDGGHLRVAFSDRTLPTAMATTSHEVDSRIIAVALDVKAASTDGAPTILVSKDVNLRIRADALGLVAADYEHDRTRIDELYTGVTELETDGATIDRFYREGVMDPPESAEPNQFVQLVDRDNRSHTGVGRVDPSGRRVEPLSKQRERVWGITARNREQQFALNLLLDDRIKLLTIVGKAGTGKTLLALAAALRKAHEEKIFQRVLVSRPIFPLGRDVGYLPGDIEEKLRPWMQPIFDNLELLMGLTKEDRKNGRSYEEMLHLGMLEVEPLTYIRGRSIPDQFMIVDEAQNLTVHEVKTIVSRAGEGTKIVLTGDPYQIDNPYMDANSNGLVHAANRFRGRGIAGHITLLKGERSELAELAANVL